jgi:hypothetical protein
VKQRDGDQPLPVPNGAPDVLGCADCPNGDCYGCDAIVYGQPSLSEVLYEIRAERARQDEKFGDQSGHPDGTGGPRWQRQAVLDRWRCQVAAKNGRVTWEHILTEEVSEAYAESDPVKLRAELVQIGAVACAWIEAIDRRTEGRADGSAAH